MNRDDLIRRLYEIECEIENIKKIQCDFEEDIKELEKERKAIEKKLKQLEEQVI